MKNPVDRLEPYSRKGKCLNVIVETPKGSRMKYAYDPESGLFGLKRALPEGMMFPFNFGFIPGTLGGDGDALDILVLNQETLISGCLVKVRLLGVIKVKQTEKGKTSRNDRLIGLAIPKETPTALENFSLDKKTLEQIEYFFITYNKLDGKKLKILGYEGPKQAKQVVRRGIKAYRK
jgi:inorganic pyrophosphatase